MCKRRRTTWAAVITCAGLLLAFAALSYSAALTKSATIDEPTHLVAGWVALRAGDYRVEVANPAGWKMWAALADAGVTLHPSARGPLERDVGFAPEREVVWCSRTLFDTPGTDGDRIVQRARAMMLLVSVSLGAVVATWAYQLAGPVAAVVAAALYSFDPTMLAHAPLVKSDLAVGLTLVTLGWLTWHAGRRLTVVRAIALGVVCGVAVNVKFSGVLTGPILAALLLLRALGPTPWPAFGRIVRSRPGRLVVAALTGLAAATVCLLVTWACYRFRYRPAPSPTVAIDMPAVYARVQRTSVSEALGRPATAADAAAHPLGPFLQSIRWADDHRLLPQAFLAGLAYQSAYVALWPAYLNGQVYADGRWYYFPLAALYKTPLPELAAFAAAVGVGFVAVRKLDWSLACVALPALAFGAAALRTHLNVGLRSVLPFYAFADVAAGCAAAWASRRRPRLTAFTTIALLGGQCASAVLAWPDYIPFFNAAVGGPREGLSHLADSNVDWGQDVKSLADWQRAHPDVPLYVDLFTSVDPAFYGVRCQWLWTPDRTGHMGLNLPDRPAVLAVSATHLLGMNIDPAQRPFLAALSRRPPREVLHGSIYLYDYRP
jgi:hypothetical protein